MAANQQTVQKMTDPKSEHFMKKVAEIEVDWPFLDDEASAELNRRLRRGMAQMAGGLSPAMLSEAYTEWLTHLAANPGKLGDCRSQNLLDLLPPSRLSARALLAIRFHGRSPLGVGECNHIVT